MLLFLFLLFAAVNFLQQQQPAIITAGASFPSQSPAELAAAATLLIEAANFENVTSAIEQAGTTPLVIDLVVANLEWHNQVSIAAGANVTIRARTFRTTLNANEANRHFSVDSGGALVLEGLELTRGYMSTVRGTLYRHFGGSVFVSRGAALKAEACFFTRNAAPGGGAVFIDGGNATFDAKGCTFNDNAAASGAAVVISSEWEWDYYGTIPPFGDHVHFVANNCTFNGNTAGGPLIDLDGRGGAIACYTGRFRASSCIFYENTVLTSRFGQGPATGGAVFISAGMFEATNCVFDSNRATKSHYSAYGVGAAVFVGRSSTLFAAVGCSFSNNHAAVSTSSYYDVRSCGGAVYVEGGGFEYWRQRYGGHPGKFECTGCVFTGNSAYQGGAVCVRGSATIIGSTFTENTPDNVSGTVTACSAQPCGVHVTVSCTEDASTPGVDCECPATNETYSNEGCVVCPAERACNSSTTIHAMLPCPPGHFCSEGAAFPGGCPAGSFAPLGSSSCTPCPIARYCPPIAATPLQCPVAHFCPAGSDKPTVCPGGALSSHVNLGTSEECGSNCTVGHYCVRGATEPQPCTSGYYCPLGAANMTPCPTGRYARDDRAASCDKCPPGRFASAVIEGATDAAVCDSACDAGRFSTIDGASNADVCQACAPGFYGEIEGATECMSCDAGHFLESTGARSKTNCTMCPIGRWSNVLGMDSLAGCKRCEKGIAGRFASSRGALQCTDCPFGRTSASGSAGCFYICTLGEYIVNISTSNTSACKACPPGKFGDQIGGALSASECTKCPIGHFCEGGAKASLCPPGRWSAALGASDVLTCFQCKAGRFSAARGADMAEACNACPPGKRATIRGANSSAACVACEPTTFAARSGQTACEPCTSGYSVAGSSFCTECAAGKELDYTTKSCSSCAGGHISGVGEQCVPCVGGTFERDNSTKCEPCPPGTWSNVTGATSISTCTPCPAGTFSSATGVDATSKCNACPPGTSSAIEAANASAACVSCAAGYFAKRSGQTACGACDTGSAEPGSSYCADCAAGKQYNTATNRCVGCDAGFVSETGGACRRCAKGTYASASNSKCTPCPSGTWSNASGASSPTSCASCAAGTFSSATGVDAASKCNACPPGKKSNRIGRTSADDCSPCVPGRFAAHGGQPACAPCAAGSISSAGSSLCTLCPAGKELMNSSCVACARGETSVGGGACRVCEKGRYATSAGSGACERCPDFMTSFNDSAWRCVAAVGYVLRDAWNATASEVPTCPEFGTRCLDVAGARIFDLELLPGWWRPTHASLALVRCKDNSSCVGGRSVGREGEGVCSNATTGPYCAVCAEGFKRQGGECVACDALGSSPGAPLAAMLGAAACIAAVVWAARKRLRGRWAQLAVAATVDGRAEGHGRIVEKFKISYAFAQVVSSGFEEFNLELPQAFATIVAALSIANLDVFGFLSIGCVVDVDFYDELVATCAGPVVMAVLALGYATLSVRRGKDTKHSVGQTFTEIYLVVLFCVYAGVTRKVFTTFKCEHFETAGYDAAACGARGYSWSDDGLCFRSFLRADLSISCDAATYARWRIFAGLMVLVYPLGVPLLFARLLRHTNGVDESLSFICAAYKDEFYWWEIVELGRKLLVTFVLIFFMEGTASQIVFTILVASSYFAVLRSYKPYRADDDDRLAALSQALLAFTSLAALCLKVDVTEEDRWSEGAFDAVLSVLVISVPIVAGVEMALALDLGNCARRLLRRNSRASSPSAISPADGAPPAAPESAAQPHDEQSENTAPEQHQAKLAEALLAIVALTPSADELKAALQDDVCTASLRHNLTLALSLHPLSAPQSRDDPLQTSKSDENARRMTVGTQFHEHITRAAMQRGEHRRETALFKAHKLADQAAQEHTRRIESQRRVAREKFEKRKEASCKKKKGSNHHARAHPSSARLAIVCQEDEGRTALTGACNTPEMVPTSPTSCDGAVNNTRAATSPLPC